VTDLHERLAGLSPEKRRLLEARLRVAPAGSARGPIPRLDPAAGPAPLSFVQERLRLAEGMGAGAGVYNMAYAVRLRGRLDADALRAAVDEVVRRHEPLRTVFGERDGRPVQVVLPPAPLALPPEEVGGAEAARDAARREAEAPFDAERGPLFRARLLRVAADEHVILLTMHHAVGDGWSLDVLFRELTALYAAFVRGEPSPLAELPVRYADYSAWQREQVSGARLDAELAHWRSALSGAPAVLDLPADRPRPASQSFRGAIHRFDLPAGTLRGLRALAADAEATPFMALLAAFGVLLSRYAGADDLLVGTPVTHRTRPELQGLVGFFVNTLALRVDLSGDPSFRALLGRARATVLEAYAHRDAPFDRVVEAVRPERDASRNPLVQAVFALRDAFPEPCSAGGVEWTLEEMETGTAKFDLTLEVAEQGDGATAMLEYAADLFDAGTVERIAAHYRVLLAGIVADPDRRVSGLPLMEDAERRRVVEEWNATGRLYPSAPLVHERVAEQARIRPAVVAVTSGADSLTYGELDARAERLAAELRRRGVGPETRVGVLLARTPSLVVAQLAVLKAGAAYLPLDPALPEERVAFMLADAGVQWVVGEEPPTPPGPLSPASGRKGEPDGAEGEDRSVDIPLPQVWGGWRALASRVGAP